MIAYWRAWRGAAGAFGGGAAGHLPESGGFGDQAAVMLDAFAVMDDAEARLRAADEDRRS